jgi:hypothetical protein
VSAVLYSEKERNAIILAFCPALTSQNYLNNNSRGIDG